MHYFNTVTWLLRLLIEWTWHRFVNLDLTYEMFLYIFEVWIFIIFLLVLLKPQYVSKPSLLGLLIFLVIDGLVFIFENKETRRICKNTSTRICLLFLVRPIVSIITIRKVFDQLSFNCGNLSLFLWFQLFLMLIYVFNWRYLVNRKEILFDISDRNCFMVYYNYFVNINVWFFVLTFKRNHTF